LPITAPIWHAVAKSGDVIMASMVDWLELAKQARAMADNATHSASRGMLLNIAADYEAAAGQIEALPKQGDRPALCAAAPSA
jgi:hypothetical protein